MSEQDNVKVATASFEALTAHDLNRWTETTGPGFQTEGPGAPGPMNAEQFRAYTQTFITAFPDLHFDVQRAIAQGDYVVLGWTASGTHNGPLVTPGGTTIPPTGRHSRVPGSTTFEIKNGKTVRSQNYWDMVGLLNDLGLMPGM